VDEQDHGRALTLLIVIPAIYALVREIAIRCDGALPRAQT